MSTPHSLLNHTVRGQGPHLVLIHGLFGSLSNLGVLARELEQHYTVISVDLRNHGQSFHASEMNYDVMAQDLQQLLIALQVEQVRLVGHSMGGKAAMKLASLIPNQVCHLAVLDMAPVAYQQRRHDDVLRGLNYVAEQKPHTRQQAQQLLAQYIKLDGVRQFLTKSLYSTDIGLQWRFNLADIERQYLDILAWQPIAPFRQPTLFIKGAQSDYISSEHQSAIQTQFPNAKAHIIANTGHWLHAEKPQEVLRVLQRFLAQ